MGYCGPSGQEKEIAAQQQNLATTLKADFEQRFKEQSGVLDNLNQSLTPIVTAGPSQQGFSPQELAVRNTAAINNAGAANRNAVQAAQTAFSGQGGGATSGITSGVQAAIKGGIASSSANQLADTQNAITAENYDTGRSNYFKALAGEQALAGDYNPQSFASESSSTGSSAFDEADKLQAEKSSQIASIVSGVGSLATGVGGGLGNLDTQGTSTAGEQALNFATGFFGGSS